MAARPLPKTLLEEVTCSICVEYLKDPVSIPCGHSFCKVCITKQCDSHKAHVQDPVSCPICKKPFQKESISPNWVLAQLVPNLLNQELSDKQSKDSKQPADYQLCKSHGEKTFFYCETDEKFLCFVCKELREHSTHVVLPVEDAAQPYKDEIQRQLENLKKSKEEIMHLKENNTFQALLNQIQDKKQRIVSEYQQFRNFLDLQEQFLLAHMEELEKDITCKKEQHVTQISQKISHLEELISKMESASQTPREILKIRKQLEERRKTEQVLSSFTTSQDLEERVCAFTGKIEALEESMRRFKAPWLQLHLQNKATKKEMDHTVEQMLCTLATEILTQSKLKNDQRVVFKADMSEVLEMVVLGKLEELSSKLRMKMKIQTIPLKIAVIGNASQHSLLINDLSMSMLFHTADTLNIPFVPVLQELPDIETYGKPATTYLKETDCGPFDVVIIVVSAHIGSVHSSLAIELHNMGKQVYFISRSIQPPSVNPPPHVSFGFKKMKMSRENNLRKTELSVWNLERIGINNPQVFLISVMKDIFDISAFSNALKASENDRRTKAQILRNHLSQISKEAIEKKKTALQGIIGVESLMVALQVSASSGVLGQLRTSLSHYQQLFRVDELSLTNLAQMLEWNIEELNGITKSWNLNALIKDNQKLAILTGRKVGEAKLLHLHSYQKLYEQAQEIHKYFLEIVANDAIAVFQKICLKLSQEVS